MITIAQVRTQCKALGIGCKWLAEYREFRIGNNEAEAYYTDDREDAIDTARAMAAKRGKDE